MVEKPNIKHSFKRRKQLEQDLEHVTQEMYRRNLELAETNRTLSLLRTIDALVLESHDSLQSTCQQLAQAVVKNSDYLFVAIFTKEAHRQRLDLAGWGTAGSASIPEADALYKGFLLEMPWFSHDHKAALVHLSAAEDHTLARHLHLPLATVTGFRTNLKAHAIYFVQLWARQKLVGVMAIGLSGTINTPAHAAAALLERLSEAVGVALDNKLLYEENQRVLKQLQKTNQKLLALDEAKDDFISMASHQLRTPLTSVKGYISMVLDGDVGKVNVHQRKMLDQAFISSQRMVYLIADLLNVSRLKTGKFVLETKATNLADAVEGEIRQLVETAKGRGLTLIYKKPQRFPTLVVDETKLRQVIMNFVDNAIYYTPSGGTIKVNLVNRPSSVELTVVDNGIGVPKIEQPRLFTKFYRAVNAKKARPDGTGLGLFMAKKVIIAQGGALIFKSQEGKGSTFGFTLPKAKLAHATPTAPN